MPIQNPAGSPFISLLDETGTSYDMLASDANKYIRLTNSGAKTIQVQNNSTEPLLVDCLYTFHNAGAGDATLVEDSSVSINPPAGGSLVFPENSTVSLKWIAVDTFDLIGVTVSA